jgi:hypothetical protein
MRRQFDRMKRIGFSTDGSIASSTTCYMTGNHLIAMLNETAIIQTMSTMGCPDDARKYFSNH